MCVVNREALKQELKVMVSCLTAKEKTVRLILHETISAFSTALNYNGESGCDVVRLSDSLRAEPFEAMYDGEKLFKILECSQGDEVTLFVKGIHEHLRVEDNEGGVYVLAARRF